MAPLEECLRRSSRELTARVAGDVSHVVSHATSEHDLTPSELRALAQALRDLASDLCERAGRAAEPTPPGDARALGRALGDIERQHGIAFALARLTPDEAAGVEGLSDAEIDEALARGDIARRAM